MDILVIDFYALHLRIIDAFKGSYNLKTLHFNAMLKTSIKDKLVLRFSRALNLIIISLQNTYQITLL